MGRFNTFSATYEASRKETGNTSALNNLYRAWQILLRSRDQPNNLGAKFSLLGIIF
jgi:hypothetical protein